MQLAIDAIIRIACGDQSARSLPPTVLLDREDCWTIAAIMALDDPVDPRRIADLASAWPSWTAAPFPLDPTARDDAAANRNAPTDAAPFDDVPPSPLRPRARFRPWGTNRSERLQDALRLPALLARGETERAVRCAAHLPPVVAAHLIQRDDGDGAPPILALHLALAAIEHSAPHPPFSHRCRLVAQAWRRCSPDERAACLRARCDAGDAATLAAGACVMAALQRPQTAALLFTHAAFCWDAARRREAQRAVRAIVQAHGALRPWMRCLDPAPSAARRLRWRR